MGKGRYVSVQFTSFKVYNSEAYCSLGSETCDQGKNS